MGTGLTMPISLTILNLRWKVKTVIKLVYGLPGSSIIKLQDIIPHRKIHCYNSRVKSESLPSGFFFPFIQRIDKFTTAQDLTKYAVQSSCIKRLYVKINHRFLEAQETPT